ncbi:DNA primase [Vibrio variabilis]|uniref:DNA primase n=1 Tax=Vibrio variabilis TaxID=990271 RepID=A0ABQ0JGC1_9VIBR|nr:DNA primase [Vibrio variabilis]
MPLNPTTGNRYKGINAIHLMAQGKGDPRWMTYKQASALNAQVRKGEKGTLIQYWKFHEERNKKDANGKAVLDSKGKPIKEQVKLDRPRPFSAVVFNAEQIDGLPKLEQQKPWNNIERAEHILQQSGASIFHGEPDGAFYRPSTDSIHLPNKEQFSNAERYYAVALHELGHWTGHASRLERDLSHPFGSEGYAREELRAEIGSMILSSELGIEHDTNQHATYVGSWIKALKEDPLEIFRAASDAEKIHQFVMSFDMKHTDTQEQKPSVSQGSSPKERQYLAVPYEERTQAKEAGAKWDKTEKSWYVSRHVSIEAFSQWLPNNIQETTKLSPQEEFAQALKSIGCEVDGEHPIMDGQKHRIRVETDKPNVKHQAGSGYYVGYLDGHPAGFMKNYKTGEELKWKSDSINSTRKSKPKSERKRLKNAQQDLLSKSKYSKRPQSA